MNEVCMRISAIRRETLSRRWANVRKLIENKTAKFKPPTNEKDEQKRCRKLRMHRRDLPSFCVCFVLHVFVHAYRSRRAHKCTQLPYHVDRVYILDFTEHTHTRHRLCFDVRALFNMPVGYFLLFIFVYFPINIYSTKKTTPMHVCACVFRMPLLNRRQRIISREHLIVECLQNFLFVQSLLCLE